jgi:hypothetical protein
MDCALVSSSPWKGPHVLHFTFMSQHFIRRPSFEYLQEASINFSRLWQFILIPVIADCLRWQCIVIVDAIEEEYNLKPYGMDVSGSLHRYTY